MPRGNPPDEATASPSRSVFDTLKGIGILEVIVHHCLGQGSRKFADHSSVEWWIMRGLNRVLHFAIPLFLLVSAILLTQSLVKRPDAWRFAKRRVMRTLWPYLLWSAIYWGFRLRFLQVGSDVYIVERTYPIIGTLTGPHLLVDLPELFREVVWGKAYFHLYFMVVLLQLAILLPFVIAALRGRKLSLPMILGISAVVQVAVFLLQANFLRISTPASMAIWYVPSILVGVWVGLNWKQWPENWMRFRWPLVGVAIAGLAVYLPLTVRLDLGLKISSLAFNVSFSTFTIGVSLLLVGIAPKLSKSKVGGWIARFGQVSLPMFLVHPILLYFLGGPRITAALNRLPFTPLWTATIVVGLSYVFARLMIRSGADNLLFGQRLPRPATGTTTAPAAANG